MATLTNYPAIVSGLTALGQNFPEAFYYNQELYMITGFYSAPIKGYKWNPTTSAWEANALFEAFNTNPGNAQIPCVFYFNNELYLLCGSGDANTFKAFKWSVVNSRWETNVAMATGVALTTWLSPTVFEIGTDLFLIVGKADGLFAGYKWNGTQWQANATIINGLVDIGNWSRPETFYYSGNLYLIHASPNYAWKWNVGLSQWEVVSFGNAAFPSSRVTMFVINGITYGIYGSSTPGTWRGLILTPSAKINSVTPEPGANLKAKLTVNLSEALEVGDVLTAYNAPDSAGLTNPIYIIELTQKDSLTWEYQTNIAETEFCYFKANQTFGGTLLSTKQYIDKRFFVLPTLAPTVINITDSNNYRVLNNPTHNFNHGSLIYNGFVYGSARNYPTLGNADIFKIEAADYSNLLQNTIYLNKNQSLNRMTGYDQIIFYKGFLWTHVSQYLLRLNPTDLDYMIFSGLPGAQVGEPLVSDGNYIYLTGGLSATKIDGSLLTGTFASYGYDGSAPVPVPIAAILQSCVFIQHHPTSLVQCHSAIADSQYLYCAQTTTNEMYPNGYDYVRGINFCHLQKIRKSDMVTVNDVLIPKSTDDMVQNSEYVFLAPEISDVNINILGVKWGLFAVKKQTFEIKYLKALTPQQYNYGSTNMCYGVFYFGNKIAVQQTNSMQTVVIDISNITNWGDNYPIGGATDKIIKFQLNGVNFTKACNELNIDNNGMAHTNTWEAPTLAFRFPSSTLGFENLIPIVQSVLIESLINQTTIGGFIISPGSDAITQEGLQYGTDKNNLDQIILIDGTPIDFSTILNLTPGIYFFRAFATNSVGTGYGTIIPFVVGNLVLMSSTNDDVICDLRSDNRGLAVRCAKPAPGIADGTTGTAIDIDGNEYPTIVINEREWFTKDLRVTKYRNAESIPNIKNNAEWAALTTGAYCKYNNQ